MSERDRQRHQPAERAARSHSEEQVVRSDGRYTAATRAVELLIAAAVGMTVYLLGTWTAAVVGGVLLAAAVVMRTCDLRGKRRHGRGTRPSE